MRFFAHFSSRICLERLGDDLASTLAAGAVCNAWVPRRAIARQPTRHAATALTLSPTTLIPPHSYTNSTPKATDSVAHPRGPSLSAQVRANIYYGGNAGRTDKTAPVNWPSLATQMRAANSVCRGGATDGADPVMQRGGDGRRVSGRELGVGLQTG